jgi:hypothetical protein
MDHITINLSFGGTKISKGIETKPSILETTNWELSDG